MREARAAYRAIPSHLLTSVAAGPWIRLYSFQSLRVLNAQLQAVISLQSYATAAEDPDAAALAARMQRAAAATLPSFDTGYWTYYSLPHEASPLDYQQFVVQLLKKLAPTDPRFADAATRFAAYQHQPPAFQLTNASLGALRFWLSKPATVQVNTAAGPTKRLALGDGWHTLAWPEPKRPGVYPVHVTAVDWAANRASFDALPIVRATAAGSAATARTTAASTKAADWNVRRRRGVSTIPPRARRCRSSVFSSPGSASPGPPAPPHPTRVSAQRCSDCPPGSGACSN